LQLPESLSDIAVRDEAKKVRTQRRLRESSPPPESITGFGYGVCILQENRSHSSVLEEIVLEYPDLT